VPSSLLFRRPCTLSLVLAPLSKIRYVSALILHQCDQTILRGDQCHFGALQICHAGSSCLSVHDTFSLLDAYIYILHYALQLQLGLSFPLVSPLCNRGPNRRTRRRRTRMDLVHIARPVRCGMHCVANRWVGGYTSCARKIFTDMDAVGNAWQRAQTRLGARDKRVTRNTKESRNSPLKRAKDSKRHRDSKIWTTWRALTSTRSLTLPVAASTRRSAVIAAMAECGPWHVGGTCSCSVCSRCGARGPKDAAIRGARS